MRVLITGADGQLGQELQDVLARHSLLPFDPSAIAFGDLRVYSIISITLFLLVEFGILLRLRGSALLWPVYLGLFVNPLVLVYVPYPLQESFLVLAFAALVPWLLALDHRSTSWRFPALLGFFFGAMYMARASHLVIALPVVILFAAHLRALPQRVLDITGQEPAQEVDCGVGGEGIDAANRRPRFAGDRLEPPPQVAPRRQVDRRRRTARDAAVAEDARPLPS